MKKLMKLALIIGVIVVLAKVVAPRRPSGGASPSQKSANHLRLHRRIATSKERNPTPTTPMRARLPTKSPRQSDPQPVPTQGAGARTPRSLGDLASVA